MTIEALLKALADESTGQAKLDKARRVAVALKIEDTARLIEVLRVTEVWHEATAIKAEKIIKANEAVPKKQQAYKEPKTPVPIV